MNTIIMSISFPYRLIITLVFVLISILITWYSSYKKHQKKSFFEKNVSIIIKSLENNINKLEEWSEYIKNTKRYAFQMLRKAIYDEILPTIGSTGRKSKPNRTMDDSITSILLILKDSKPITANEIRVLYESIKQQIIDTGCTCPQDLEEEPEQAKLIISPCIRVLGLKNSMGKLAADLQDCVEIAREESK